jgi:hypothetical protein
MMMFTIGVRVYESLRSGLDALDERRRLKLADASELQIEDNRVQEKTVSEGFARAHFPRDLRKVVRYVSRDLLCPGDLADRETGSGAILYAQVAILSSERIQELWLAAAPGRGEKD